MVAIDQAPHPGSLPSDVDIVSPQAHTGVDDCVAANTEWSGCVEKDARAGRHQINRRLIAAVRDENVGSPSRTADFRSDSLELVPVTPRDRKTQLPGYPRASPHKLKVCRPTNPVAP